MHEMIERAVAHETQRDRLAVASAARSARSAAPARKQRQAAPLGQVVIRLARPADAHALEQLGQLDADLATSRRLARLADEPWEGSVLVAEVDGDIAAALVPEDGTLVADPFRPTASLGELLHLRAGQLAGARASRGRLAAGFAALRPRLH